MTYKEIRSSLKTGDIVLFSGSGFVSSMIKWFTGSKYSHVGLVIVDPKWDQVLLWESTTLSKVKTIRGNVTQGVAIRPLSDRVDEYDEVAIIQRIEPLREAQEKVLIELRKEFKGKDYEHDKIELFKSAYDFIGGHNEEDLSSIFCSELVAEFLQRIDDLSEEYSSNEFTPEDFTVLEGYGVNTYHYLKVIKGEE